MSKIVAAGVMAIFIGTVSASYAQAPPAATAPEHPGATDAAALTDVRIAVVKAALQLTPDQEKLWPPVEDAIRNRAKNRQARIAAVVKRLEELHEKGPDALREIDPIAFLQRRAEALSQRSADLNKLAEAWQPLYKTLNPDQKRRLAFVAIYVLREVRDRAEERRGHFEDEED